MGFKGERASAEAPPMSMTAASPNPSARQESSSVEDRIRRAKRTVTASGMRVGRSGAMVSSVGIALIAASFAMSGSVQTLMRVAGVVAILFGLVPFSLGWKQSKQGSPFLRALTTPEEIEVLLMEEKALAGDRRSLSLLLGDGTSQSVALAAEEAGELFALVQELNPAAQCEVVLGAQRQLATLKP
jgi:Flp pilus assembly protein TadB